MFLLIYFIFVGSHNSNTDRLSKLLHISKNIFTIVPYKCMIMICIMN